MATSRNSEARAKVTMESASFEKGAKAVANAANSMSAAVTAAFATAGAAIALAFGAESVKGIVNSAGAVIELGEQMANAGKRAGIAAGQFYLFNNALEKGLSLETVAELIGENAEILNQSATIFRDVSIKLWAVGEKIRGFWLGLMDRVAPVLSRLLDGTLGTALIEAGERFGDTLADAVKVVYTLAEDGELWNALKAGFGLAFNYAGERLIWLSKLSHELFKVVLSTSFDEGITEGVSNAWDTVKDFASHMGEQIADAFYDACTVVLTQINKVLDAIDYYTSPLDHGEGSEYAKRSQGRKDEIVNRMIYTANDTPFRSGEDMPGLDRVKGVFDDLRFEPTSELANQIAAFQETINGAISRYDEGEAMDPTRTFENNSRRVAFGADSMASIGGGGNFFTGFAILDIQRSQLGELREINRKLDYRQEAAPVVPVGRATGGPINVSRGQRGNVMNGTY